MYLGYAKFSVNCATIIIAIQIWAWAVDGDSKNMERVINGTKAKQGQFPWVVRLDVVKRKGSRNAWYTCTGSLASTDFVLTASHCIKGDVVQIITYMGDVEKRSETEPNTIQSKRHYVHPCYDAGIDRYDIGLIELERPYHLEWNVQLIRFSRYFPNDPTKWDGKNVVIVGWGVNKITYVDNTKKTIRHSTDHLLYANEWVIPIHKWASYGVVDGIGDWWLLRVVGNDTSMCTGDSGGPLLYVVGGSYKQIGIAKSVPYDDDGNICLQDIRHQTYIRTDVHLDWIMRMVNSKPIGEITCQNYKPSTNGLEAAVSSVSHDVTRQVNGEKNAPTEKNTKAAKKSVGYCNYLNYLLTLFCITLFRIIN